MANDLYKWILCPTKFLVNDLQKVFPSVICQEMVKKGINELKSKNMWAPRQSDFLTLKLIK